MNEMANNGDVRYEHSAEGENEIRRKQKRSKQDKRARGASGNRHPRQEVVQHQNI